jgi:hypothetical protein
MQKSLLSGLSTANTAFKQQLRHSLSTMKIEYFGSNSAVEAMAAMAEDVSLYLSTWIAFHSSEWLFARQLLLGHPAGELACRPRLAGDTIAM